jgi:hypothetical protein
MDATIKRTTLQQLTIETERESGEAVRTAQYAWLNELPGLCFGLITLVYIAASLIALV